MKNIFIEWPEFSETNSGSLSLQLVVVSRGDRNGATGASEILLAAIKAGRQAQLSGSQINCAYSSVLLYEIAGA